jgi:cob(I)alamin adenosyltransferase
MENKIYTKTGDKGTSGLLGGTRVSKTDPRLEAYGTTDELNSWIGLISTTVTNPHVKHVLSEIQKTLFTCGSILSTDSSKPMSKTPLTINITITTTLEKELDRMQNDLPLLSNFILPGGSANAALCHIARTVCRRAERRIVALNENSGTGSQLVVFINRLSDYLFVLSRFINYISGHSETIWKARK